MTTWYCFPTLVAAAVFTTASTTRPSMARDVLLFVGDGRDNTVKRFDADTGTPLNPPGPPFVGGLHGPRGLCESGGRLLVVNQNIDLQVPGEVRTYDVLIGAAGRHHLGHERGCLVRAPRHRAGRPPRPLRRRPDDRQRGLAGTA